MQCSRIKGKAEPSEASMPGSCGDCIGVGKLTDSDRTEIGQRVVMKMLVEFVFFY